MNKKAEGGWTLPSIFGAAGLFFLVAALTKALTWGFGALGIVFIIIAIWLFLSQFT